MGRKSLGGHRPRSGDGFFKVRPNWERDKNKSDRIAKVLAQRDRNLPVRWGGEGKRLKKSLVGSQEENAMEQDAQQGTQGG